MNRSPYYGVSLLTNGHWQANCDKRYLGTRETPEEAAILVDGYLIETGWPNAYFRLNFPERVVAPEKLVCYCCGRRKASEFDRPFSQRRAHLLLCRACRHRRRAVTNGGRRILAGDSARFRPPPG